MMHYLLQAKDDEGAECVMVILISALFFEALDGGHSTLASCLSSS